MFFTKASAMLTFTSSLFSLLVVLLLSLIPIYLPDRSIDQQKIFSKISNLNDLYMRIIFKGSIESSNWSSHSLTKRRGSMTIHPFDRQQQRSNCYNNKFVSFSRSLTMKMTCLVQCSICCTEDEFNDHRSIDWSRLQSIETWSSNWSSASMFNMSTERNANHREDLSNEFHIRHSSSLSIQLFSDTGGHRNERYSITKNRLSNIFVNERSGNILIPHPSSLSFSSDA